MAHAPSYPPTHPPIHPPTCYSRLAAGGRPGAPRAAGPRGDLLRGGLLTSSRTIAPPPRGSGGAAAPLAPARCSHKAVAKAVTKLQYSSMNVTGIGSDDEREEEHLQACSSSLKTKQRQDGAPVDLAARTLTQHSGCDRGAVGTASAPCWSLSA